MAAFEFVALDPRGRRAKGVLEGDSPRQVRQSLRQQGMTPLRVDAVEGRDDKGAGGRRHGALKGADVALLTRQLAVLLRSGAPIEEALASIARQSRKGPVQRVVMGVRSRVMEGHPLAAGLEAFPGTFSDLYRATVEAGEEAGHLEDVLDRLADYTESRMKLRQRLTAAMLYPAILTVVALLVLVGLLGYVVPQVVTVFENIDQDLPLLTRLLLDVSDAVQRYGLVAVVALVAVIVALRRLLRREALRFRYHRVVLGIPGIGNLVRSINSARFARTLAILNGSGVPILHALEIAARVVANLPMRRAIADTAVRVREGELIHKALEATGQFPPITVYLIANGEVSGRLEEMLARAAQQQEDEADNAISTALALFEPLLILGMGAVVLVIVLAILLPIFELNQMVG